MSNTAFMINILDIPNIETNNTDSVSYDYLRENYTFREYIGFNRIQICRLTIGALLILFGFFIDTASMKS